MDRLNLYLEDGTFDGSIIMSSPSSKFTAVRVRKEDVSQYANDLDGPGIYFLLIGNNSVYVGQTGLDPVRKRIMNTHSGNIDSSWHTVIGFVCSEKNISANELYFLENAMCEYAHKNYHCLTTSPAKANCNSKYRNEHYHLGSSQIHTCNHYVKDIQYYLASFQHGLFKKDKGSSEEISVLSGDKALFCFASSSRDSEGRAEILIHCGHSGSRNTLLKAGSRISTEVSPNFASSTSVLAKRKKLEEEGKIKNRILQVDILFKSQSGAGEFLNGTSFDGNSKWKTVDGGVALKEIMK